MTKVETKKYFDYGQKATDLELNNLEARLRREYQQASKEVTEKMNKHLGAFAKKDEAKKALVDSGKLAKDDYIKWRQGQLYTAGRWSELSASLTQDYVELNQRTAKLITDNNFNVFALGHNFGAFEVDSATKTNLSWSLYNKEAVEALVRGNKELPLVTKMNIPKDMQWNKRQIESAMTQGILQGESIPNIAKRLPRAVGEKNLNGAIRRARTLTTFAENAGRLDAYKQAAAQGIQMQKCWIATMDNVTRDSHADLFGECVDLDKTFSNGLDEPGGSGPPEEVYNCRCCIIAQLKDHEHDLSFADEWKLERQQQEFEEWEDAHSNSIGHIIAEGKDISNTWERRPDKFDFEIEDVINAQGFDGLPQVVSPEEFDKAVKAANNGEGFIAQRTYSAPDKATLDAYRDQLYNGKWYVDCSTGGAQYGQGMYCAADYSGKLTDGIKAEMQHYQEVNIRRFGENAVNYTETMTLHPSAKVITYDDIFAKRMAEEAAIKDKYTEKAIDDLLKANNLSHNHNAKILLMDENQLGDIPWEVGSRAYKDLKASGELDSVYDLLAQSRKDVQIARNKGLEEYNIFHKKYDDLGVYATSKGYDAINAVGHGESSSYTVILNRTKVIIKGK